MNETPYVDRPSDVPWPTSGPAVAAPGTSMLPGGATAPPPAVGMLKHAVQGAHETIDRLAERATPAVEKLGQGVSAAETAVRANAAQLRVKREQWTEGLRTTVRGNPLVCVAAAVALGVVIARLTR